MLNKNFNDHEQKIHDFILNHKDLIKIDRIYLFKTLDFSVDEVVTFAQEHDLLEMFIDPTPNDYREGIYIFRHGPTNFEVKSLLHGFWGSIGIFDNLTDAVKAKLNHMPSIFLFRFSDTKRKRKYA